jgi:AcrR family transcriptional regulator
MTTLTEAAARYSAAQRRTVDVALELFATNGVGGTSLQMIADALGVTKAAVYHQFRTKDAIALAVIEVQLQPFEEALERSTTSDQLLEAVVGTVVANRRSVSTIQADPVLFRLLAEHPPSLDLWVRLFRILLDGAADDRARVQASVLSATIGAVAYPFVIDLDDATLRTELLRIAKRVLGE